MSALKKMSMVMAVCLMLGGCSSNRPLYAFDEYETQMHKYFKGTALEKSISDLEKAYRLNQAKGFKNPPGLCAHLGMMYHHLGRDNDAATLFNQEKLLYPESTKFMNMLLNKL